MDIRIQALKFLSLIILVLERATVSCWRLVCWMMGFAALWLFEIPLWFESSAPLIFLVVFFIGATFFIIKDVSRFRWPSRAEIEKRLERDSGVAHRPLTNAKDTPVQNTSAVLWQRERTRLSRTLSFLKAPTPRAFLAARDPRAIRLGLVMAVFCGVIIAGAGWEGRILNGLAPPSFTGFVLPKSQISLWITPPDYTRREKIILSDTSDETLEIPQGSILKAVVTKRGLKRFFGTPSMVIGSEKIQMSPSTDGSYTFEAEIPDGELLTLHSSAFSSRSWSYQWIEDTAPRLQINDEPQALPDGQTQFSLTLFDDYGVQDLNMRMTLDPVVKDAPTGWAVDDLRSIMSPANTAFQIAPSYDLAAHPWAGLPVVFTFMAHDHLDQISLSDPVHATLPERNFTHPIARKLIEVRKYLAWNPDKDYREPFVALDGLLLFPHEFAHDMRVYLALRMASLRLAYNEPSVEIAQSVMALLWDTALRLEDGNLSLAARNLRDIQKQLEKALQGPNVSDAQISALMQELREALSEYMQALAREWQKRAEQGQQMPMFPPEMLSNMMNMNDLAGLLDQMESDLLSGDRNAAQDMLSKLQRLMDMANPSMQMTMPQDMQMMMEGLNELEELVERQEELRDQTAEQARIYEMLSGLNIDNPNGGDQPPPFINTQENQTEQDALRYILGQLMLEADGVLNDIPENLGLAEQAMRNSGDQLGGNRPDKSLPFQDEAIQHLEDAQQQMQQQLAQRMQQMTGFAMGGSSLRFDPLGRPMGREDGNHGDPFGSKVKVPSEAEKKRIQDILNELRRRAAQRDRPREELEYYRRLLRRF